jgi:hypothetical protein
MYMYMYVYTQTTCFNIHELCISSLHPQIYMKINYDKSNYEYILLCQENTGHAYTLQIVNTLLKAYSISDI